MEEQLSLKEVSTDSCRERLEEKLYKINKASLGVNNNKYLSKSQVNIYTDGSKIDDGVGSGYVVYQGKAVIGEDGSPLNKESTVFQAELEAIRWAADFLAGSEKVKHIKYVKIFSDSMLSLQALDSLNITSKTVLKAARSLNNLANKVRWLNLCWIKAHVGHEGNEQADKLARDATVLISTERLHESKCVRKETLRKKMYKIWEKQWKADPNCRQTKQFFGSPDPT